jgi:ribosomal protein S18 acetylase RimI-like enzyme
MKDREVSAMPIREMLPIDIPEVVRIHLESFPGFFLSFLGPRFLAALYESVIDNPYGIGLISESEAGIEGFVAGVTDKSEFSKQTLRKRALRFALASMGTVIRKPSVVLRLFRTLGRFRRPELSAAKASLMSIAVRPGVSGKGTGRELVAAFDAALAERGVDEYSLTTDRDDNDRVNRFYLKLGFRLAGTFVTPEGRAMNEYVMTLRGRNADSD